MHDDQQSEIDYAPLSKTAMIALVLSVFSAASVISFLFWFLGIMSIVVALMSLHIFKRNRRNLKGRSLAVIGLIVGIFFTGWGLARFTSHQWWIYRHAEQYTTDWLHWVEDGKLTKAYNHVSQSGSRAQSNAAEAQRDRGLEYFDSEPLKTIRQGKGSIRLNKRLGIIEMGPRVYVTLRYFYEIDEGDFKRAVPITITLTRRFDAGTLKNQWFISALQ